MSLKLSTLGPLTLVAIHWASAQVLPPVTLAKAKASDVLLDPSSTKVQGGRAKLTTSVLVRQWHTYTGNYQFDVSPYFFKSEKGRLTIEVSDETLDRLASGVAVDFTGLATTNGSGKTRPIQGKATPVDTKRGTVVLRLKAENRELQFNTAYRFAE